MCCLFSPFRIYFLHISSKTQHTQFKFPITKLLRECFKLDYLQVYIMYVVSQNTYIIHFSRIQISTLDYLKYCCAFYLRFYIQCSLPRADMLCSPKWKRSNNFSYATIQRQLNKTLLAFLTKSRNRIHQLKMALKRALFKLSRICKVQYYMFDQYTNLDYEQTRCTKI